MENRTPAHLAFGMRTIRTQVRIARADSTILLCAQRRPESFQSGAVHSEIDSPSTLKTGRFATGYVGAVYRQAKLFDDILLTVNER